MSKNVSKRFGLAGTPAGCLQKGFVTKFSKSSTRNFFKRYSADDKSSWEFDLKISIFDFFVTEIWLEKSNESDDIIMTSSKLEQSNMAEVKFKTVEAS